MSSGDVKNPNLEDLMRLGVNTAKAGNKDNARVIFQQVLASDKRNVGAWLWMAELAEDNIKRRAYLETVLRLSPNNPTATRKLSRLDQVIQHGENASLRMGIRLVALLIVATVIVAAVIIFVTKVMH